MEPKIIAMYLPQYHEIPENNKFWGQGILRLGDREKGQAAF